LGFWFLLNSLSTDGVWETVILNVLFFLVFPLFVLGGSFKKKELTEGVKEKINVKVCFQILAIWAVFMTLLSKLNFLAFVKINYLARTDWFLGDWWAIFFINLFLIPLILISQEFFFRKFLIGKLDKVFSSRTTLLIQAGLFVFFEILFFEIFYWQFILFNFILALLLGWMYQQTKSIWYSFFTRWILILLLDGVILYKIQQLKL
jgi:membrane protease YdiL (CAAX protease family)